MLQLKTHWDEAFQAEHVLINNHGSEVILTTEEALQLWRWLEDNHDSLYQASQRKQEHRAYLEQ